MAYEVFTGQLDGDGGGTGAGGFELLTGKLDGAPQDPTTQRAGLIDAARAKGAEAKAKTRTWGELAGDTGLSLLQGAMDVASLPVAAFELTGGSKDNAARQFLQRGQQAAEELKSDKMQAVSQAITASMATAETWQDALRLGVQAGMTPEFALNTIARSIPQLFAGAGIGSLMQKGASGLAAAGRLVQAAPVAAAMSGRFVPAAEALASGVGAITSAASKVAQSPVGRLAAKITPSASTAGAIGSAAVLQGDSVGQDTFDVVMKRPVSAFQQAFPEFDQAYNATLARADEMDVTRSEVYASALGAAMADGLQENAASQKALSTWATHETKKLFADPLARETVIKAGLAATAAMALPGGATIEKSVGQIFARGAAGVAGAAPKSVLAGTVKGALKEGLISEPLEEGSGAFIGAQAQQQLDARVRPLIAGAGAAGQAVGPSMVMGGVGGGLSARAGNLATPPAAPTSFADPNGPAARAGITPVVLPGAAGLPARGAPPAAPSREPSNSVNPVQRTSDADLLTRLPEELAPPDVLMNGIGGAGYATERQAQAMLPIVAKEQPGMAWTVQPREDGKFQLAGRSSQPVNTGDGDVNASTLEQPGSQAQAQAAPGQTPTAARGDAAATGRVPAASGASDVQAAGVVPAAAPVAAPPAPLTRARTIEPGPAVVLQNRDRSSAASVAQMNEIAAKPDYLRTGPARVMDSGAPVVFGDAPETALVGREETVADGRGQRTQTQYMVVEAGDLLASNLADGTRVPDYEQGQPGKLRAVAGNGRAAGITEAYSRGTASQYKADLVADAQALGMEPAAIEAMRSPVLVRVMSGRDVTPDMGDRSNIAGTARLSASEQANTDARRIDLSTLEFDEQTGNPTANSVRQFTSQMPTSERGELLNKDGTPTRQAIDRLMAATFKQAYGSDDLVQLYAQATDIEARTVMAALADAAGAMAGLSEAGDLDIRGAVTEAAGMAVNARRRGMTLADMLQNADFETSGEAFVIARFFADNIRSAKKMAEGLRNWANYAAEQAQLARENQTQEGLFGAAPVASRADVFRRIEDGQVPKTNARQPARQDAAADGAERAPDDARAGQAGAAVGSAETTREQAPGITTRLRTDGTLDVRGDVAQIRQRLTDGGIAARSILPIAGGVLVGTSKAAQAQALFAESVLTAPTQADIEAQQGRADQADTLDQREQTRKESEVGDNSFMTGFAGDGRQDTTGDIFASEAEPAKPAADQTETPEFKRWFGASQVVDADGKPLVMYHGTSADQSGDAFTRFDTAASNYGLMGMGAYFTADPAVASSYTTKGKGTTPTVYPVFLSIQNPLDMDGAADANAWRQQFEGIEEYHEGGTTNESWYRAAEDLLGDQGLPKWEGAEAIQDGIRAMGFDGITHMGGGRVKSDGVRHRVFIAFDDVQVKSATGNSGAFDPNNPDIRFSRSPMKSIDANVRRGMAALAKALDEKTTVHRAMFRNGLGWVDFVWGSEGVVKPSGKTKGAMGISHIQEARQRKDGMTDDQALRLLQSIVDAIASGTETRRNEVAGSVTVSVEKNGVEAILTRRSGSNTWLVSGWNQKNPDAGAAGSVAGTATSSTSTTAQRGEGAGFTRMIEAGEPLVNQRNPDGAGAGRATSAPTSPAASRTRDQRVAGFGEIVRSADPDVNLSRGTSAQGIPTTLAQQIVDAIRARWANAPDIVVVADMQDAAIPERVRQEDAKQRSQGATGTPEGFFYDGQVYLVASALNNPGDVVRVLFHEALGHAGLRGVFGDALTPILKELATLRRAEVAAKAREYGLDMNVESDRLQAAEEVLAVMAQTKPELSHVRRAIAAIRAFLRKNVPGFAAMDLTDADIVANFILPARAFVERGTPASQARGQVAFQRAAEPIRVTYDDAGMPVIAGGEGVTLQYAAPTERLEFIPTSDAQQMFTFQISTPSNPFAGQVDVLFENGAPVALYDIEVYASGRGDKAATRTVKALLDATQNGKLAISNIVTEAQGFWATLGVPTQPGLEKGRAYDGTITRESYLSSPAGQNARRARPVAQNGSGESQGQTSRNAEQGRETQELTDEDAQGFFPDTRFSRRPLAAAQGLPTETPGQAVQRVMQDQYNRVNLVQQIIAGQGGLVGEEQNVYKAEERMHGRVTELMRQFKDDVVDPFLEKAVRLGVNLDDLALYAYAKHAPERNRAIQAINPNVRTGSGMSDVDAQAVVDSVTRQGDLAKYEDLHADMMAMTAANRRVMVDEGLITQDEFDALDQQYEFYVPLRGFEHVDPETGAVRAGSGRGFSVTGRETIRAMGRDSRAGNIIENIILDYQRYTQRSETNSVGKTFLDLVTTNPNPDLWQVAPVKRKARMGPIGLVEYVNAPDSGPDTIVVKVAGQDVRIKIKDELLARAMTNAFKTQKSDFERKAMRVVGSYTSLLRNTITRYNPIFGAVNAVRDAQMGAASVYDELGTEGLKRYSRHYAGALAAGARVELGKADPARHPMDRWMQEMRFAGGTTGGIYMRDVEDVQSEMRDAMLKAGVRPTGVMDWAQHNTGTRAVKGVLKGLELIGATSEHAARLAAYAAAREMGKTPGEAASIAKNLTVNFNRFGEVGQWMNTMFLFYNAAVQGSTRIFQIAKNPKVRAALMGATAVGLGLAMMGAAVGGDDDDGQPYWDKIPEFEKQRNLIIMLPPGTDAGAKVGKHGRYIKIPMAYGLNVFPVLGYQLAGLIRNAQDPANGVDLGKAAVNMTSAVMGSFNPFGGALTGELDVGLALAAAPTFMDPAIQLSMGVNGFGRPVGPEKSPFDQRPDSEVVSGTQHGKVEHRIARWMNEVTDGNQARSGWIDVQPGTIKNVQGILGGGLGTFIGDTINLGYLGATDLPIEPRDIPLYKGFYGEYDKRAGMSLFYERSQKAREEFETIKRELKGGIKREYSDEDRFLMSMGGYAEKMSQAFGELKKREVSIAESAMASKEKVIARREVQKRREELADAYNAQWFGKESALKRVERAR